MKHSVIALRKHSGEVEFIDYVNDRKQRVQMVLPEGCTGIVFCFESKKMARQYWGKNVSLIRFEVDNDKSPL